MTRKKTCLLSALCTILLLLSCSCARPILCEVCGKPAFNHVCCPAAPCPVCGATYLCDCAVETVVREGSSSIRTEGDSSVWLERPLLSLNMARTLALSPLRHICLLVQEMIPSELSGVLFTAHPITGDKGCLVIETVLGLGELLVQGDVDVSHYELHTNGTIISSVEPGQDEELILVDNMLQRIHLPSRPAAHLSPQQLHELSQLGVQTENIFGMPQDIEWAMANGKYWLLQARPITTL